MFYGNLSKRCAAFGPEPLPAKEGKRASYGGKKKDGRLWELVYPPIFQLLSVHRSVSLVSSHLHCQDLLLVLTPRTQSSPAPLNPFSHRIPATFVFTLELHPGLEGQQSCAQAVYRKANPSYKRYHFPHRRQNKSRLSPSKQLRIALGKPILEMLRGAIPKHLPWALQVWDFLRRFLPYPC